MYGYCVCNTSGEEFDVWSNLSLWTGPGVNKTSAMDVCTAASLGYYDVIAQAVKCNNGMLSKRNKSGWTPLMYACQQHHEDIVKLLVDSGVDVNCSSKDGLTPLMLASKGCDANVLQLLLHTTNQQQVCIEATDDRGWTALFHAVNMGQEDSVKLLLHSGANVNAIESSTGHNVLMVASKDARVTLVQALLKAGAACTEQTLSIAERCGNKDVIKLLHPKVQSPHVGQPQDLVTLLESLGLEKYWPVFRNQAIDLQIFLTFTEAELKNRGINLLGPRRKMSLAIARWHNGV